MLRAQASDPEIVTHAIAEIETNGFVVLEDIIPPTDLSAMHAVLQPLLDVGARGRNDFEGFETQRVYSLVGRHQIFADLVEHPLVLGICDAFLEPNYLLTASQAINIRPGETPQSLHTDDAFYRIPRPRKAISISTIFAIDAFTHENGATQIVPGSHIWDDTRISDLQSIDFRTRPKDQRRPSDHQAVAPEVERQLTDVTMAGGSVIVFLGTLMHRGGANRSTAPRLALSNQYCEPWARQQENYFLSIPHRRVRQMSPRVQQLLGYSIHPPFMGHANGVHPLKAVQRDKGR
jgi:ectoine hydroxylase-related dioxygenase (phytanoyl-CoA dioxygenase family)